jgi:hypothetical protein
MHLLTSMRRRALSEFLVTCSSRCSVVLNLSEHMTCSLEVPRNPSYWSFVIPTFSWLRRRRSFVEMQWTSNTSFARLSTRIDNCSTAGLETAHGHRGRSGTFKVTITTIYPRKVSGIKNKFLDSIGNCSKCGRCKLAYPGKGHQFRNLSSATGFEHCPSSPFRDGA